MKKIQVTQSSMPSFEDFQKEIKDIWDSKWLTNMGVKHQELEQRLSEYLDVESTSLFTNGHLALEAIMQAFELEGEVITTPFTFASTTHAIVRCGLKPIFCDINEHDYTIDADKIESLITDKTCAILPVHVYGNICDVGKIERIAEKYDLKVIYDAAHAFGVKVNGQGVANFGDASMFSFHATKVFNTIEGGAVCFNKNDELYQKLRNLKNFGITGPESVVEVAGNAKMNEFCAAMGLCNLRNIDSDIAKRKAVYERYIQRLDDVAGIKLQKAKEGIKRNYAYFPVSFENYNKTRDEVFNQLKEHGIFARKYFYPITSDFDCYKDDYDSCKTPVAQRVANNILTLPMYSMLELEDVDYICDNLL